MLRRVKIDRYKIMYMFFLMQPLVSVYRTFFDDNIKIAGFSFFEMINTFFIIGLWMYVVAKEKNKKGYWVISYFFVLGMYCIVHYYNIAQFNMKIFNREIYDFVHESYYIFRAYGLPILLLSSLLCLKLEKEFYTKILCDVAFLISIIIVGTNFLKISLCTYVNEGHVYLIQGSIFDWFSTNGVENMKNFTSTGWFSSGNEVSAMLLMTLPVIIYRAFYYKGIKDFCCLGITMVAMLMLGTKTATIGSSAIFLLMSSVMIVTQIVQKNQVRFHLAFAVSFLLVWGVLFCYSPFIQERFPHKKYEAQNVIEEEEDQEEEEVVALVNDIELSDNTPEKRKHAIQYINNSYWNHFVNKQFIDKYPVEQDLAFWIKIINRDAEINQNYRLVKKELISRIIERNNRSLDQFFGVGLFLELDCEQDYVNQYFMFGIVGIIVLLGGIILILLRNIVCFLKHIKSFWREDYISVICALGIGLTLPYVTGHMFGVTMVMFQIVLATVLVEETRKDIKNKREVL